MNTPGASHDVQVYDINDTSKYGWQYGVTVTTKPVSAASTPYNGLHTNSLPNLIGTAFAYSPAQINKVEIKLKCEDGSETGKYWQGGISWKTDEKWNLATGTTDWIISAPSPWPLKTTTDAGKFRLWTKSYDDLGSTETVTDVDYITFYVDKGAPQTAIYEPSGNYINSKPLIKGTAEEPSYSDTTNSIITNVELAIKYISGTGTTYYWQHYVSSGEWKATTSPLWIDADAQDGAYDTASEQWSWDSSEVDWQNQTKHWVYTRAYDGAGNVESPASEMWLIYDVDTGQSVVTTPQGGGQNYNSMTTIEGTASDAQGVDYVDIAIYNGSNSNYFDPAAWDFTSGTTIWIRATGTTDWSWDSSTVTWNYGTTYTIKSRMTDLAGNPEVPSLGKSFVYDNVAPLSEVIYPADNSDINDSTSTFTIYGTAEDSYSNVSKVELVVRKEGVNLYWNGSDWQSDIYWLTADLWTSSWSYTGVNCGDGSDHKIWIRAYDDVLPTQNKQSVDDSAGGDIENGLNYNSKFKYDVTEPVSDISYPGTNLAYNVKIETFTGTYNDPNFGSGVSQVRVAIRRTSDNQWWIGAAPYWSDRVPLITTLVTGTTFEFYISDLGYFYLFMILSLLQLQFQRQPILDIIIH